MLFDRKNFTRLKRGLSQIAPLCSADIHMNKIRGLVSVVLPVYNGEKYLAESITSVLAQDYENLELIIVDDGSADMSGEIADEFSKKDDRIKVLHQKNMKLPCALNNGFALASGEYLTWTSADNRMLPSCLSTLVSELCGDRTCDMVFANMRLIDQNGNPLRGRGWYELPPMSANVILPDDTRRLNTVANNTIGAAFLYRCGTTAVLNKYSEYKYMLEDYDFFMRMNSLFRIKHTLHKKPIYEYRMHPGSLTARDEELGITASRPRLMELDALRRDFYTRKMYYYTDGEDRELAEALKKTGTLITSARQAERLAKSDIPRLVYINLGNAVPTFEPRGGVPSFLCTDEPLAGAVGFNLLICRNSSALTEFPDWVCAGTPESAASLIFLRAKNDILYNLEASQCAKGI